MCITGANLKPYSNIVQINADPCAQRGLAHPSAILTQKTWFGTLRRHEQFWRFMDRQVLSRPFTNFTILIDDTVNPDCGITVRRYLHVHVFHIIAGASYKSWANFHRVLTSMLELLDMVPIKCEVIFHDTWIRFVLCIIIAHNDGPIYRDCIRISIRYRPLECALNSCMCNFMIGAVLCLIHYSLEQLCMNMFSKRRSYFSGLVQWSSVYLEFICLRHLAQDPNLWIAKRHSIRSLIRAWLCGAW